MADNGAATETPSLPAWRRDLADALIQASGLLFGVFLLVRVVAFQFAPYSAEGALAGLAVVLISVCAWGAGQAWPGYRRTLAWPLALALVLWLGLLLCGCLRSPNEGLGFARLAECLTYVLLLFSAHKLAGARPALTAVLARAVAALGCTEAFLGLWQRYVDLPQLWSRIQAGMEVIPDELLSQQGQERLFSTQIFGTFGNSNSFAAFLLITIFVQLGLWFAARAARPTRGRVLSAENVLHAACLGVQCWALGLSGSKGAGVAAALGVWFFAAQAWGTTPGRARLLRWLTVAGIATLLALLLAGALCWPAWNPLGKSMEVRFGYWHTAWAMIRDQPLLGQGLGAFGDAFPFFKHPCATETIEAHNDWLQAWAELGLLGPLAWGLLWFLVLRPRAAAGASGAAPGPGHGEDTVVRRFSWLLLAGVLAAFGVLYAVFESLSAQELRRMLQRAGDDLSIPSPNAAEAAAAGAPHALGAGPQVLAWAGVLLPPLVFALAFLGSKWWRPGVVAQASSLPSGKEDKTQTGQAGSLRYNAPVLLWALRAASGAVLVHELADFDFTAQGVMAALFILAGLLAASGDAAAETPRRGWAARACGWAPLGLALAALPCACLMPLLTGLPRKIADEDEDFVRQIAARLPEARESPDARRLAREDLAERRAVIVRRREEALAWAPFDGQAAQDLAMAYYSLWREGRQTWPPGSETAEPRPLVELVKAALAQAQRCRPLWHHPAVLRGHLEVHLGLMERARHDESAARAHFILAESFYERAARRYPLSPAQRLQVGDAFLWEGRISEAAAEYAQAWEIDRRIADPNTRFASIFLDPRPGCLVKHNRDPAIAVLLAAARGRLRPAGPELPGLLERGILTAAWLRSHSPGVDMEQRRVQDAMLVSACQDLVAAAPHDGHALFFLAAALAVTERRERRRIEQGSVSATPWPYSAGSARSAWQAAREMQAASLKASATPDTLPQVFDEIAQRLAPRD